MAKWLLITTTQNPGDSFARFGVETLIREVDPEPVFIKLDKEGAAESWAPVDFDRCILCGMPIAWSHAEHHTQLAPWWEPIILGWPTADKRKFMALGVGDAFATGDDVPRVFDPQAVSDAMRTLIDRAWKVTTRTPFLPMEGLIDSIDPAAFLDMGNFDGEASERVMLCNIMEGGAHEPHFNREEANVWKSFYREIANDCRKRGFQFVAHSEQERELGIDLGFERVHFFKSHRDYLPLYARCREYVGNRLHGAMLAYISGASTLAIGYDSRKDMLAQIGCIAEFPSQVKKGLAMSSIIQPDNRLFINRQKHLNIQLVKEFANDC